MSHETCFVPALIALNVLVQHVTRVSAVVCHHHIVFTTPIYLQALTQLCHFVCSIVHLHEVQDLRSFLF